MAVIRIAAFGRAFQPGAFQVGAFQTDNPYANAAGDIATPQEIAYLERRRRLQQYLDARRARQDRRRLRALDKQIDDYLNNRDGAEGERDESERPASERAVLANAVSAAPPRKGSTPVRSQPPGPPSALGNQLMATAVAAPAARNVAPNAAHAHARIASYQSKQDRRRAAALAQFATLAQQPHKVRQDALQQILTLPAKPRMTADQLTKALAGGRQGAAQPLPQLPPARMTPDQLLAALARGQREMQRIRGY